MLKDTLGLGLKPKDPKKIGDNDTLVFFFLNSVFGRISMTGFFCHFFLVEKDFAQIYLLDCSVFVLPKKRYFCTQINENYVLTFAKDICKIWEKEYIISLICQRHFLNFCLRIDKLKHTILACPFCMKDQFI